MKKVIILIFAVIALTAFTGCFQAPNGLAIERVEDEGTDEDSGASGFDGMDIENEENDDSSLFDGIFDDVDPSATTGEKNALKSARNYLEFSSFSHDGLIEQLEFEKYTNEEAVYAADHCGADWNEQALLSARRYLEYSAFSHDGLIEQLEFEKFTTEEATYGADNCGADWNEQAALSAEKYLEYLSYSKESLIDQLEFEGFTHEQAVYGAEQNGF